MLAQNSITMISFTVDRVASISEVRPGLLCQVLKMRLIWVREAPAFGVTFDRCAMNFLQEDNVCPGLSDTVAHSLQHKPTIATAIALVDVVGQYIDVVTHRYTRHKATENYCSSAELSGGCHSKKTASSRCSDSVRGNKGMGDGGAASTSITAA